MGVYYFLVNQAQVIKFSSDKLEIVAQVINPQIQGQIAGLLLGWTGQAFNVIIAKKSEIETLKEQLISQTKQSREWQIISNDFPDVSIEDIVLK